jgi:hypothetical protein
MDYYTYAYLREDKTPYYIGKGKGNRIFNRSRGDIRPPKDKSRVIYLKQNITEEEAFKHEIYMISVFGRKDLDTGILRNKTNGGEGSSGAIRSDEYRKKLSESRKGTKLTEEHKNKIGKSMLGNTWNVGRKHSDEMRRKVSESNKSRQYIKGRKFSEETKKKLSESHKGKTPTEETRKKLRESKLGRKWWYNPTSNQCCISKECPGDGWVLGRKIKNTKCSSSS